MYRGLSWFRGEAERMRRLWDTARGWGGELLDNPGNAGDWTRCSADRPNAGATLGKAPADVGLGDCGSCS